MEIKAKFENGHFVPLNKIDLTNGHLVRTLDLGVLAPGAYVRDNAPRWNGRNTLGESVSSGLYFYELQTQNYRALRKMVVEK